MEFEMVRKAVSHIPKSTAVFTSRLHFMDSTSNNATFFDEPIP
jgi:hypothetical protein